MVIGARQQPDERLLLTGNEAGTPPGDRKFRPDVQGIRAIAVVLVVLFHAHVPGFNGGYVGVEVFFVISGFVITGLLLREHVDWSYVDPGLLRPPGPTHHPRSDPGHHRRRDRLICPARPAESAIRSQ